MNIGRGPERENNTTTAQCTRNQPPLPCSLVQVASLDDAMAYSRGPSITMTASASHFPGNLAVLLERGSSAVTYGVASRSSLLTAQAGSGVCSTAQVSCNDLADRDPACYLTQVKWCRLRQSSNVVLVLTSYRGFKFMDRGASLTMFDHVVNPIDGQHDQHFCRGIASIGNCICVGSYDGDVLVYNFVRRERDRGNVLLEPELLRHLQGHSVPVCDIAVNGQGEVASCDETGMIIVWIDPMTSAESSLVFGEDRGAPCFCLSYWNNLVIGGFSNGLIRIYDAEKKTKVVEIAAHARTIVAIDVAMESGLLLSVGEDSTASVWRLTSDTMPQVSLVYSVVVKDSLLCGGKFCDTRGNKFALTAYDSKDIIIYNSTS